MSASRRPEPPLEILERMRHPVPMEERPDAEARRRAAIDAIAGVIRDGGHAPRRRSRWLLLGVAAAAALAGGALWLSAPLPPAREAAPHRAAIAPVAGNGSAEVRVLRGTVVTTRGDLSAKIPAGGAARVAEGDEVTSAAGGEAKLLLPRGVRVEVAPSTQLSLVKMLETEQRLHLGLGRTEVSVPKPGGPGVFSVETPDSEVVVHGTEFSVLVERNERTSAIFTTVSVMRGSVFVTHDGTQRLLEPGATWSSRIEPATAPMPSAQLDSDPLSEKGGGARRGGKTTAAPASLGEQNRLFQTFLDAREEGDDVRAVRLLDELLTRFPDTPLADQARVARFRALQRLGQAGRRHP